MNAKTELFLCQCFWVAGLMVRPTWTNLQGTFAGWRDRDSMWRQLRRLEDEGWLEGQGTKGKTERVVRLTQKGVLLALGGRDPEERWNRSWDGKWRMVVFDLPEEQRVLRNALRKQLRAARFGGLQGSVWISPDPLGGIGASLKATANQCGVMTFFEGVPCGGESAAEMVAAAWDFEPVQQAYAVFRDHLAAVPQGGAPGALGRLQEWWQQEHALWQTCMAVDPLLPKGLLPASYAGQHAWRERQKVMSEVAARLV
jgi:phenylacetic acid degradation operon negative regulatory protein